MTDELLSEEQDKPCEECLADDEKLCDSCKYQEEPKYK